MGPVVDVEFENNDLPFIKDALEVYSEASCQRIQRYGWKVP